MAERRKAAKKSWRGKEWYDIFAPPTFGGTKMGETLASSEQQLLGRVFETTLGDLIDDFSKSHVKLFFQIKNVDGKRAFTNFVGHDMPYDYIKSQLRRRTTKVGDISTVTTQDGLTLRISSMVITSKRIQTSQTEAIRKDMHEVVKNRAQTRTFDQFVQEIVLGKLSADIYKEVKRYCPVKRVEVFKTKVLTKPT